MTKVLLLPDAFCGEASGAVAAREATRILESMGHEVAVLAPDLSLADANEATREQYFPRAEPRVIHHVRGGAALAQFIEALERSRATHVLFLGAALTKPASFFAACRHRGVRTIAYLWIQDFYCLRNYGCLANRPCALCIGGNYWHALRHGCRVTGRQPWARWLGGVWARRLIARALRKCDAVLASSNDQLQRLNVFGVPAQRLVKCPLFFPRDRLAGLESRDGDYFIFFAQTVMAKGWELIPAILDLSREAKYVVPVATPGDASQLAAALGIAPYLERGQLRVLPGLNWSTGVARLVAEARGVIIPSVWPTTTEYVWLESLGLGKPVVAFAVGIHGEEIRSGDNGLLADVGNVAHFAKHVRELIADAALRQRLSKASRELFGHLTAPERYREALARAFDLTTSFHR